MATQFYYFKAKAQWCRLYEGMEDEKFGHYGLDFFPDDVEAFKASGVQLQPRENEDGDIFFKLRRHPEALIKGELTKFGPPKVVDKDNEPFDKLIGNGSEVTVKIAVYDTAHKGKGHRLESVRVEDLVVYEKDGEDAAPKGEIKGEVPTVPF